MGDCPKKNMASLWGCQVIMAWCLAAASLRNKGMSFRLDIFGSWPGAGKSTLSAALAKEIRGVYLWVDVVVSGCMLTLKTIWRNSISAPADFERLDWVTRVGNRHRRIREWVRPRRWAGDGGASLRGQMGDSWPDSTSLTG